MSIIVPVVAADGAKSTVTLADPILATPPPVGTPQPLGPAGGPFPLVFQDEFTTPGLDTSKWSSMWFNGGSMDNVATSAANVAVGGGACTLTLSSPTVGATIATNPNGGAKPGFQFTTGIVEARVMFPGNDATKKCYNWGGFWTTGQNWPATGENDIAECLGGVPQIHHIDSNGNPGGGSSKFYLGNAFHIFTMQRFTDHVTFWYDGVQIASIPSHENVAASPHYLVLTIGNGNGSPVMTGPAGAMVVDYVRAWSA